MVEIPFASGSRSRISERWSSFRRDVLTILRDLSGKSPPPFSVRVPLGRHLTPPQKPSSNVLLTRSLHVVDVVRETADAVSLHVVDPTGAALRFTPGQFFTVVVSLAGGDVLKRAYSLSMVPGEGEGASKGRITIKRTPGGRVSNYLNTNIAKGDVLTVLGPSGSFGISEKDARSAHLLLIAGGSGITPLRAIVEGSLGDPSVTATLLYGNRSLDDVIFRAELSELESRFAGRLRVRHVLENPPSEWSGGTGLLDRPTATKEMEAILSSEVARGRVTHALVCGPTKMMESAREVLLSLGVRPEHIREEQFSSPDLRKPIVSTKEQPISIRIRGKTNEAVAGSNQTVLEAGLSAGIPMPFSCAMGGCGVCKVKLVSGQVASEEPNCLTREEAQQGFVLACVSRAVAPLTVEVP